MSRRKNDSAQIFFGLWLLPLGYLVFRSGSFPKVLAVLLAIGGVGYVVDLFTTFLAPGIAEGIEAFVIAPTAVGELSFVAYLLVKGVRVPERPALVPPPPDRERRAQDESDRSRPVRLGRRAGVP